MARWGRQSGWRGWRAQPRDRLRAWRIPWQRIRCEVHALCHPTHIHVQICAFKTLLSVRGQAPARSAHPSPHKPAHPPTHPPGVARMKALYCACTARRRFSSTSASSAARSPRRFSRPFSGGVGRGGVGLVSGGVGGCGVTGVPHPASKSHTACGQSQPASHP